MLKCIIFDWDGTIADTYLLCTTAFSKAVAALTDLTVTNDMLSAKFGLSEEGILSEFVPGRTAEALEIYHRLYEDLHPTLCPKLIDGIPELLSQIKEWEIPIALVTGKGAHALSITLRMFDMEDYFAAVETGKPNHSCKAASLRMVLDKLRFVPEEAVYIGDSVGDIFGSRKAGVPALSVAWTDSTNIDELWEHNPGNVFSSVPELGEYLASQIYCEKNPVR